MTVYTCDIYEIKEHSQVKVVLAFTIESVSSCFLIHFIYTIHVIVVNRDDVRTRNKCFCCRTFCSSHYVSPLIPSKFISRDRTGLLSYHLQQMIFLEYCKSFLPLDIFLSSFNFGIYFRYCSYGINSILKYFINQCWAVKKLLKTRCNKFPLVF